MVWSGALASWFVYALLSRQDVGKRHVQFTLQTRTLSTEILLEDGLSICAQTALAKTFVSLCVGTYLCICRLCPREV